MELINRPRRLRSSEAIRKLVRETTLITDDFIYPYFILEGENIKNEIKSMPGIYQFSIDNFLIDLEELVSLGIKGILLFGVPDDKYKDEVGSIAYDENGIVQKAIRGAKENPELLVGADVCLCEYTSHGHCGVVHNGRILNDESCNQIVKLSLSYAKAGADIIAPSDMMDGRIGEIRRSLDENGFEDRIIMAYSAKYASSFYGPFREAACSKPAFGDRKTYQMDYCNFKESIREVEMDINEGADIIMIKPAMAYLDIIREVSSRYDITLAAYNVSGEYSMIKAAASNGWIDEKGAVIESLIAIKRAGAKIIITYFAKEVARWINGGLI